MRLLVFVVSIVVVKVAIAGNDNTYIANDSGWVIMANVCRDRCYLTKAHVSGGCGTRNIEVGMEYEWERVDKTGLSRIDPGTSKVWHITGDPEVYVTILARLPNGKAMILDNARPIKSDRSILVQSGGHTVLSKYGHIWRPQ